MKTNAKNLVMAALATLTLAACGEKDLYDETFVERNAKATYADNFAKKYPGVNLSQNWDFTSRSFTYSLPGSSQQARTRATDYTFQMGDWYEVEDATLSWLHGELTEGTDNRKLGNPFYMSVPGSEFTIVPIFQGVASAVWNLHVVVDGHDITLWHKSQYMQIKDTDLAQWHDLHSGYHSWDGGQNWVYSDWESQYNTIGGDRHTYDGKLSEVTAVRSIPYTFKNLPVGADMYFYLEVTQGDSDRCTAGTKQSSLNGMMLALDCPLPSNIPENYESMIIGCEDANLSGSDWDMNDVVFLVYGPQVPKPVEIHQGDPIVKSRTVRYMIEDLGATDDFDFNDIVVDVTETCTTSPTVTNGVITAWSDGVYAQYATIRHLGGTLPFRLTIGNTKLEERQGVLGADPNETFEVTGWNPDTHNISIQVQQHDNQGVYNNVTFPRAGEAPMIIAVEPTQAWMPERQSVPESWFYIPE